MVWHIDECRLYMALRKSKERPPSSPAICHFHWGHLRRAAGAGNMGKVQKDFFPFPWVGFLSRFIAATFCAHAIFPVRFYAQLDRLNGDSHWKWGGEILKEDKRKAKEHRGPGAGWGSSLCCWSGCHITPCGDDCAIYCLAGAGDLRQRNHTRREGLSPLRCL